MKSKRYICLFLSLVMLLSVALPVGAFADDDIYLEEYVLEDEGAFYPEEDFGEELFVEDDSVAEETEFYEEIAEFVSDEQEEIPDFQLEEEDPAIASEEEAEPFVLTLEETDTFAASDAIVIVDQPVDFEVEVGGTATFSVEATGVAKYQWQFHNGDIWQDTSSEGAKTDTIKVVCNETRYNYKYRCVLTGKDGSTIRTNEVKMVKPANFEIVTQPVDFEVEVGGTATFHVEATGAVSYQWQFKNGSWENTSSEGAKTDTITVTCTEARYKYQYRCILKDKDGNTLTTEAVKMVKPEQFEIVTQPVDFEVEVGGTATFSVEATGVAKYQWQFHNGDIWQDTSSEGAKTDTIKVVCNETRYNYKYRCVLTGKDGSTIRTNEVKMVSASFVENNVRYAILGNGKVSVEKYLGNESSVIIPSTVRNYNVTEIGEEAFMDKTTLQSIDLPDSITIIRARAFKGCTSLNSMS